jgi:hypothetical protein
MPASDRDAVPINATSILCSRYCVIAQWEVLSQLGLHHKTPLSTCKGKYRVPSNGTELPRPRLFVSSMQIEAIIPLLLTDTYRIKI